MKKAFLLVLCLLIVLVGVTATTSAQEATPVNYNEMIISTLETGTTQLYSFKGVSNEVVLIILGNDYDVTDSTFDQPLLTLLSPNNTQLAQVDSYGDATIFYQLPNDGVYTVEVSASTGGNYIFQVIKPEVLTPGTPVSTSVTSETAQYFAYITDAPFTVGYERVAGTFTPEISVAFADEYGMTVAGAISGSQAVGGQVRLTPETNTVYLVSVKEALFDIHFEEVQAEFTVTVTQ